MTRKAIDKTLKNLKQGLFKFLDPEWEDHLAPETDEMDLNADQIPEYGINDAVSKKAKSIINDFIEAGPLIEAAGFRIKDLEIELSVIPKLIPHFEKLTDVDDIVRADIMEQVKDKRIIRMLLKALYKADDFQKSLKMGGLEFTGIEIEITAIPAIRLIYKNPISSVKDKKELVDLPKTT